MVFVRCKRLSAGITAMVTEPGIRKKSNEREVEG